ncbi:hypothetical protein KSF78_0004446 [Schistosoma japonicum]|nr:hypothetical protein KSF78_0004446 [Schistosoma japonicum]
MSDWVAESLHIFLPPYKHKRSSILFRRNNCCPRWLPFHRYAVGNLRHDKFIQ